MLFLFFLSSQSRISVTHKYIYDFLIFKSLHVIEYAILYFFLFRAFSRNKINFLIPMIIAIFYSMTDEFHQTFVPTRSGKLQDVAIDFLGVILMYTFIKKYLKVLKRVL